MTAAEKLIGNHELTKEEFIGLMQAADDADVRERLRTEAVRLRKKGFYERADRIHELL